MARPQAGRREGDDGSSGEAGSVRETPSELVSGPGRSVMAGVRAVIVIAGILAYANSFAVPFIYDDLGSIPRNPNIRRLWPLWQAMAAPAQETVAGRPLVCLSLAVNYAVDGLNVRGYHAVNLILHLLSALLLAALVERTLARPFFAGRYAAVAPGLGAAAAALWMLHPLQTAAVTLVVQRTELLMSFFYLLTLYCAVRGWDAPRPGRWWAGATAACALGMASKETMASAPLVVLLYDRTFVSGSFGTARRRHGALYAALSATWLLLGGLVWAGARDETVGFSFALGPWAYLRTQAGVIVWYLRLSAWPHPLVMSYDDWPRSRSLLDVLPQAALVVSLLAGTAWGVWRRSALGFVGGWFFLILAPSSSVIPIVTEIAAEHRMYLPLAAIVVPLVVGGYRVLSGVVGCRDWRSSVPGWAGGGLVVVLAVALGSAAAGRNRDYHSEYSIWSDTIAKRPRNAMAHSDLGTVLRAQGRLDEAVAEYREALRLKPMYPEAHYNLANLLAQQGHAGEAAEHYGAALRMRPDFWEARVNFGVLLLNDGRYDEAVEQFSAALRLNPDDEHARYNLAVTLARQGKMDAAVALDPRIVSDGVEPPVVGD